MKIEPLQYITNDNLKYSHAEQTEIVCRAGCKWIQLRAKDIPEKLFLEIAGVVKETCKSFNAALIVNDHVHIAKKIKADGVHLGKNDMAVNEAKEILGKKFIIGGTANTIDDILLNIHSGVDYVGLGPFRYTETKKRLSPILGIDGYKDIMDRLLNDNISVPIIAIGGIKLDDIALLKETGVFGIAISSFIFSVSNPAMMIKKLINDIYNK